MNSKQLKYVLVLAEEGSFSRAADTLNISQPSLSQYIRNIEKEIGMPLFERSGSTLRLTDAGQVFIEGGRQILELEHEMQNRWMDIAADKSGTIVVGISPHRSAHLMPPVVGRFYERYPNIKLILDERSGHELMDAAVRGEFDLCVTTKPVDERLFVCEPMMKEEILLAVPSGSALDEILRADAKPMPERKYPAVDIHNIDRQNFITLGDYMPMKLISDKLCSRFGLKLHYTVEVRSNEALIAMVSSGVGAAMIPACLTSFHADSRTCFYSIRQNIPAREIVVIYRRDKNLSGPMRELKDMLRTLE